MVDIANAEKFAEYNCTVRMLQTMYKKAPHLCGWLEHTVRPATDADYYIPLNDQLPPEYFKIITVRITERLCEKLSCTRVKDREPCKPADDTSVYRVGDDGFALHCQPACFNFRARNTYSADGARDTDAPRLNFHRDQCRIVPEVATTYLERLFYRSNVVYERRVNDMPTGFSHVAVAADEPFGSGLSYRNNPTYCRYFDREMDANGTCKQLWWERRVDAVVGMAVVNTVRLGVRALTNHNQTFADPEKLPEFKPVPEHMTKRSWFGDVNAKYELPPLIDVFDAGRESRVAAAAAKRRARRNTDSTDDTMAAHTIQRAKESLVAMLRSSEFWNTVNAAFGASLTRIKAFCLKVVETLQSPLLRDSPKLLELAFSRTVLRGSIASVARTVIVSSALRTVGKTALMIAKITAELTSVVGLLLLAVTVFDVILQFWDPYGYNNMFPAMFPADFMVAGERAMVTQFRDAAAVYDFQSLVRAVLNENKLTEIFVASLVVWPYYDSHCTRLPKKASYRQRLVNNFQTQNISK